MLHTCQVYCPACVTSILTYPHAAYNPFQVRRLLDLVLTECPSRPCGQAEAQAASSSRNASPVLSRFLARVTYSESQRVTQPMWPSWKAPGIHPVAHFHALPFGRHLRPPNPGLEDYASPSPFSACDALPPLRSDDCLLSTTTHSTPWLTCSCSLAASLLSVPVPPPC